MEAICKADFNNREKAHNDADTALKKAIREGKSTKGIIVPEIGYHEIYGVWFFGQLKTIIRDRCSVFVFLIGMAATKRQQRQV